MDTKHLAPIRVAVRDIAESQEELLDVIDRIGALAATASEPSDDAEEVIEEEHHGAVDDLDDGGDPHGADDGGTELAREMGGPVLPFRRRTFAPTVIDVDPDPKESA